MSANAAEPSFTVPRASLKLTVAGQASMTKSPALLNGYLTQMESARKFNV